MPTYEYECSACHRVFEVRQRISEPPLAKCEVCGGAVRRLLSPAPFILKGGGWYVTDYPSEARKKAMESEKSAPASSSDKAEKTSTSTSKSDGKSDGAGSSTSSGASATASPKSD